jgi:hypothetical protein
VMWIGPASTAVSLRVHEMPPGERQYAEDHKHYAQCFHHRLLGATAVAPPSRTAYRPANTHDNYAIHRGGPFENRRIVGA